MWLQLNAVGDMERDRVAEIAGSAMAALSEFDSDSVMRKAPADWCITC